MSEQESKHESAQDSTDDASREDADAQAALVDAQAQEANADSDTEDELDPKVKAKIDKANREARNLRQRLKELEPIAKRARELEDSQKSETQKLTDQLAEREVELQQLRVEHVRSQAGAAAKLDPDLWEFITSADPDEALAQAKRLAERTAVSEAGPANLRQGARPPAKQPASASDALRAMAGYQ